MQSRKEHKEKKISRRERREAEKNNFIEKINYKK